MIAIVGGLGAAILWAIATLASSRSSRLIGSRVVLAWVMIVGAIVGLPIALVSGVPTNVPPEAPVLLVVAGLAYSGGLYAAYRALTIGKVSIVAPIVATEGAIAAVVAVALGDTLGLAAAAVLGIIAVGVVLSSIEPARPVVPLGDIELFADALDGPADVLDATDLPILEPAAAARRTRQAVALSVIAAVVFAIGLVASGKAAVLVPPIWVALSARVIGLVIVALPLVLQRRLVITRRALPLVVISGVGEIFGSALSAWGATQSIAVVAVLGSQFAAIAAVLAYFLFGERLSRTQMIGVVLIVGGVTVLAAISG
ncbi:MAG TPA: EamA family transporter [Candidatus Saccharimonadales bacterium]|nr:EamA family transporter [Candidatus Saccharimonadales bacterium]